MNVFYFIIAALCLVTLTGAKLTTKYNEYNRITSDEPEGKHMIPDEQSNSSISIERYNPKVDPASSMSTSTIATATKGEESKSSRCTDAIDGTFESQIPADCCNSSYVCDHYMNPGETKFDLTNETNKKKRHCDCDLKFDMCLNQKMSTQMYVNIHTQFFRDECFRKKECPVADPICPEKYEFVNILLMLHELSPNEKITNVNDDIDAPATTKVIKKYSSLTSLTSN